MRHARIFMSVIALISLLGVTPAGLAQSLTFTFTSIDPPGAVYGAYANGIRTAGGTTSVPYSAQGAENGVRNQFGEEQHQDARTFPGQGNAQGQDKHQGTGSTGSTGSTQVVGYYNDALRLPHSYLLTGTTFSAINVTGAANTVAMGLNGSGQIVGYYYDTAGAHGFVLAGTTFTMLPDAPGAVYGTFATGISGGGQIAGFYTDAQFATHGFVRSGTGTTATYTTFDAPGAVYGTFASGLNDTGQVVGYYYDSSLSIHSFLRSGGGNFTSLDITGALSTQVNAINSSGVIAGDYFDSNGKLHGFLRSATGSITAPIDYRDGTTIYYPTTINGINDSGQIAGEYVDSANQHHGYKTGP